MVLNNVRKTLSQLESLLDDWIASGDIPPIERDLALDKLRDMYDALRWSEISEAFPLDAEHIDTVSINLDDVLSDVEPVSEPEPEIVRQQPLPELLVEARHEPQPIGEPLSEQVDEQTPVGQTELLEVASVQPKSKSDVSQKSVVPSLFGADESEVMFRHRRKQQVLMSLYDLDEPTDADVVVSATISDSKPESIVESDSVAARDAEPVDLPDLVDDDDGDEMVIEEIELSMEAVEPVDESNSAKGAVLGDVINHHVQTLGDALAASHQGGDATHGKPMSDLRKMVGINDRFLLIRDLFGGDAGEYDRVISEIDRFTDLDDCMIYIAENYAWNPNSDGAKLLMELIERKLS